MDISHLRHRFRHASLGARVIAGLTILTISIAAVYSVTLWWSFTWAEELCRRRSHEFAAYREDPST